MVNHRYGVASCLPVLSLKVKACGHQGGFAFSKYFSVFHVL